jgi:hypothetical protein
MATTTFRSDFLDRDLQNPTVNALDYMGRTVTATNDRLGRPLRRAIRPISSAVTLGQEIQVTDNKRYVVTVAGTTGASDPTPPAVGATVADGTATLLRTR